MNNMETEAYHKTARLTAWLTFIVIVLTLATIGYGCYQCEETNRAAMKAGLTVTTPYLPHQSGR